MEQITKPINRVDGPDKVSGKITYANDVAIKNLAFGYLISATIAKGRVKSINTERAQSQKGVLKIFTHKNMPRLYSPPTYISPFDPSGDSGQQKHVPMQDDKIAYDLQYIALVVAESFEVAQEAGHLIEVVYEEEKGTYEEHPNPKYAEELEFLFGIMEGDYHRGEPEAAFEESEVKLEQTYTTQTMHHQPMERHGTTAVWNSEQLTIYEPTAWIFGHQKGVAEMLGMPVEDVTVSSPYVGGAFGGKGLVAPHTGIVAAAAKEMNRPLRVELTRKQLFGCVGLRSATHSEVKVGAEKDGTINSIIIHTTGETPEFQKTAFESSVIAPRMMYSNPHMRAKMEVTPVPISGPVPMRSPGEASGLFLLESALDELSYKLDMDPIALRKKNHADKNLETNLPWTSKHLNECYDVGARKFGWDKRNPKLGSMRKDGMLVGYGMASGSYPTLFHPASAKAKLLNDGSVELIVGTQEIGTGTNTIIRQIAADYLGVDIKNIKVIMGNTRYPKTPPTVAAFTAASVGTTIAKVCEQLKTNLIRLATSNEASPLFGLKAETLNISNGTITNGTKEESLQTTLKRAGRPYVETQLQTQYSPEMFKKSSSSFGANFVEVEVDPITGWASLKRIVGVYDCGKIINPKTAHSQLIGGCVFAIGMAMQEAAERDLSNFRYLNSDLGGYHMPVQADIPDLDLSFLDYTDKEANILEVKSVGELGGVGLQAAIMNAIYHATGVRIRSLPYKPEKLLEIAE
ncbi:xanthine dehydrogenase family protein molybdopterin-binding subunit [Aquimarina celericrescens]|uniref:Xanthine dehydrogenase family protein molybdopterin-binding subunit n=1 Tax=Aquimarina celericrescens TaxID=1964542 RepID=A0ABW5AXN4_9FLAO|nr:xanthine dehydrogenase family protein molybdopterin-binding subunit [Aquimarina celericrescens]